MVKLQRAQVFALFVCVDIVHGAIFKSVQNSSNNPEPELNIPNARRNQPPRKKGRSTSSSSGELKGNKDGDGGKDSSLGMTELSSSTDNDKGKDNKYKPQSSPERRGWRKWHRKCVPCPDMQRKWRDPGISWICGGYQDARRTFKSACMMRYRNCQDGTMFVKVHGHRCSNSTGDHFFYDYKAIISIDTTDSKASSPSLSDSESSSI